LHGKRKIELISEMFSRFGNICFQRKRFTNLPRTPNTIEAEQRNSYGTR
jgi:hypothetical protein